MIELNKRALEYIREADLDDAVLVLESFLDARRSGFSGLDNVLPPSLKDKTNTVRRIKEVINASPLDTQKAVDKVRRDIFYILANKSRNHKSNASDIEAKDKVEVEEDWIRILDENPSQANAQKYDAMLTDYLNDMERQAFISVYDKATDTSAIDGLRDKTRQYYIRMAAAKLRIVSRHLKEN